MPHEPVRKLSAIVSADIVEYSRMMAEDEMAALTALRSFREDIFEPHVHAHRGEIIKRMGDGWLLEFSSALDAAECATGLLSLLQEGGPIQLRIGVHVGDIVHESEDIYGDGVNVACRLQELAAPGAVLMSAEVNKIVSGSLGADLHDVGAHVLKNIPGKTGIFAWSPQPDTDQPLITAAKAEPKQTGAPIVLVKQLATPESSGEAHELAEEFHDELVIALSRHTGIRVIEHENSRHTPDYILGGRCRVSGGQARFSLTISDGASGVKMWAEKFSGEVSDVDEFFTNLAARVDGSLRVQGNAFAGARLAAKPD
ncbi:MAG: adenylate/guanylate cyclase domain-containing protein, partial [Hyphomicrobiales bacterium]